MRLAPANVTATIRPVPGDGGGVGSAVIELTTNATALFVVLTTQANGRFEDNVVTLEAGVPRSLAFVPWGPLDVELLQTTLRVEHLAANQ